MAIIDLHCDLLAYLAEDDMRTPFDRAPGCGLDQLRAGGVALQALAIFTDSGNHSFAKADAQWKCYRELINNAELGMKPLSAAKSSADLLDGSLYVVPAIENCAGLCLPHEAVNHAVQRLNEYCLTVDRPLYASLTWRDANRFGGGDKHDLGLSKDGEYLLSALAELKIPLDLTHTCDQLAYDALRYIERQQLDLPLLASHSLFRSVYDIPRNLPDQLLQEIVHRRGVIGLNFIRYFISERGECRFSDHVLHGLSKAEECIALGADFFFSGDVSSDSKKEETYTPEMRDASCYPALMNGLAEQGILNEQQLSAFAFENAARFVDQYYISQKQL